MTVDELAVFYEAVRFQEQLICNATVLRVARIRDLEAEDVSIGKVRAHANCIHHVIALQLAKFVHISGCVMVFILIPVHDRLSEAIDGFFVVRAGLRASRLISFVLRRGEVNDHIRCQAGSYNLLRARPHFG